MVKGMLEIGSTCEERRKALGLTQAEAADMAQIARSTVSLIENGRFSGSLKSLGAYLAVLELELSVKKTSIPQLDQLQEMFGDE